MSKYKKGLVADIQKKKKFEKEQQHLKICLLYTSDAADE